MTTANTNQTASHTYSEYLTHKDVDLEIRGEIFDEPFKKSPDVALHARVLVVDVDSKAFHPLLQFAEISKGDLELEVKNIKNNIEKFIP